MRRARLGLALALLGPLWAVAPAAAKPQSQGVNKIGAADRGKRGAVVKKTLRVEKGRPGRGKGKGKRGGRKRREIPPQMPQHIELTALDLITGTAHVEVVGTTRPPVTQLFILTDQSGRRFVPHFAECHPPPGITLAAAPAHPGSDATEPSGPDGGEDGDEEEAPLPPGTRELPATTRWRCSLTIPRLYRRAPLASLSMEWGAQRVAASDATVQRLWGEARAAAPLSAIAERSDARPAEPVPPPADQTPPPPAAKSPSAPAEPGGADPQPDKEPSAHASRSGRSGE